MFVEKELVTTALETIVEESPDDILRVSFHNAQRGDYSSVIHNVFEHARLDLLREYVVGET